MIKLKTKEEIKILREGGRILAGILKQVCAAVEVGVDTAYLEKMACDLMKKAGGRPAFKGYPMPGEVNFPTALCTSINEEVVHGPAIPARVLNSGDIIGIDVGMEYPLKGGKVVNKYSELGGYYTDMAKTVAVGKISKEAKKLMQVTRESLELGINQVKPGNTLNDIGRAIQEFVEKNGFSVVRDLVGHGVGHDVHEDPQVPHYEIIDNSMDNVKLKPGMVIAIEPMVNQGTWRVKDRGDFSIVTADNSLSAHFEHTIAVTEDGHEIITKD